MVDLEVAEHGRTVGGEVVAVPWEPIRLDSKLGSHASWNEWPDEDGRLDGEWTHAIWVGTADDAKQFDRIYSWWRNTGTAPLTEGAPWGRRLFVVEASIWQAKVHHSDVLSSAVGEAAVLEGLRRYLDGNDIGQ